MGACYTSPPMARVKFIVFALVALGLWGYHFTQVAPLAVAGGVEQASTAVAGAAAPVALALESQRSALQAAGLRVAGAPVAMSPAPKAGARPEAPSAERLAAVRGAVGGALTAAQAERLVVAMVNEAGSLMAIGAAEPAAPPEGLALAEVGSGGAVLTLGDAAHFAVAVPTVGVDKGEARPVGQIVLMLPVLPEAARLDEAAKALGVSSLAVVRGDEVVLLSGDKAAAGSALKGLKAGQVAPLGRGPVRELGPLQLPMMTDALVHSVGARLGIAGTDYEVVAVASAKAGLDALAGYQVFALGGLVALVLLAVAVAVMLGGEEEEGGGAHLVMPAPMPVPTAAPKREEPPAPARGPEPEPAAAPEASPDDFEFPASSPSTVGPTPASSSPSSFAISSPSTFAAAGEPAENPFAHAAPPSSPSPHSQALKPPPPVATGANAAFRPATSLMDEEEGQRTVSYPVGGAPDANPFGAVPSDFAEDSHALGDDNPEATRVAAVPQELIKAARAGAGAGEPAASKPVSTPSRVGVAPSVSTDEERHFQEVFRDFVTTREKCGEAADGLTFDKFKQKLLKNKEQLVTKYQCRTVRFQVYVKDGKAALKATPVKD